MMTVSTVHPNRPEVILSFRVILFLQVETLPYRLEILR